MAFFRPAVARSREVAVPVQMLADQFEDRVEFGPAVVNFEINFLLWESN